MNREETGSIEVNCPTCKERVAWTEANEHRPFCSKRCQLIDLGEWATESYRIPEQGGKVLDEFDLEELEQEMAQNNKSDQGGWLQ